MTKLLRELLPPSNQGMEAEPVAFCDLRKKMKGELIEYNRVTQEFVTALGQVAKLPVFESSRFVLDGKELFKKVAADYS